VLGAVLGQMIESNFRRSLLVSDGDASIFVTDPASLILLILAGLMIFGSAIYPALKQLIRDRRAKA
jgi:putative tricarboxylic transport membrane protein